METVRFDNTVTEVSESCNDDSCDDEVQWLADVWEEEETRRCNSDKVRRLAVAEVARQLAEEREAAEAARILRRSADGAGEEFGEVALEDGMLTGMPSFGIFPIAEDDRETEEQDSPALALTRRGALCGEGSAALCEAPAAVVEASAAPAALAREGRVKAVGKVAAARAAAAATAATAAAACSRARARRLRPAATEKERGEVGSAAAVAGGEKASDGSRRMTSAQRGVLPRLLGFAGA